MTWTQRDGALHREIRTPDFLTAFSLLAALTPLAEKANHHPDLELGWGYLRIKLTTHDAGGVTEKDHALAAQIDALTEKFRGDVDFTGGDAGTKGTGSAG